MEGGLVAYFDGSVEARTGSPEPVGAEDEARGCDGLDDT